MAHEALADYAVKLAQKQGATYAEARYEHSAGDGLSMKNGILQAAGFEESTGIGIRLVFHGAMQFIATDWMDKKHVEEVVLRGIRMASANARLVKNPASLADDDAKKKKYEVKAKKNPVDVDIDEKVKIVNGIDKLLKETGFVPARYLSLDTEETSTYYMNSEGSEIRSKIPYVHFNYALTVAHDEATQQRHFQFNETGGWERVKGWKLEKHLVNEAKALHDMLTTGVSAPENADLICAPEVIGIACHESVGHPYEADRILGREAAQAGESFLGPNDIGMPIAAQCVNVVDDPTLPNSAGYFLFDSEGVEARRKFLIKDGKVNEFLYNRESAWKMGLKSNGSARAMDYASEPIVRMSNTFLLPGSWKENELIRETKNGVYMKSFMEWNIDDKRRNQRYVSAEAYLIENGEITKPVKRVLIETTTKEFWSSVDAIADNVSYAAGTCGKGEPMQGVPVWMGGPSARLKNMRLGR